MISPNDLISIGFLRRTSNKNLPPFLFVRRDGLFVPFRSEQIASLMGEEIFVRREDWMEEDDSSLTWQDLVGYTLIDLQEGPLGRIAHIDDTTINTLATLDDERMLPLHEDFITDIDEQQRIIWVQLPFEI